MFILYFFFSLDPFILSCYGLRSIKTKFGFLFYFIDQIFNLRSTLSFFIAFKILLPSFTFILIVTIKHFNTWFCRMSFSHLCFSIYIYLKFSSQAVLRISIGKFNSDVIVTLSISYHILIQKFNSVVSSTTTQSCFT